MSAWFPSQWADNTGFDIYFDISLKRRLHKPSNCRWLRRYNVHCDVIVMEEPFVLFNSVFIIRPISSDIHTTYTHIITRLLCVLWIQNLIHGLLWSLVCYMIYHVISDSGKAHTVYRNRWYSTATVCDQYILFLFSNIMNYYICQIHAWAGDSMLPGACYPIWVK